MTARKPPDDVKPTDCVRKNHYMMQPTLDVLAAWVLKRNASFRQNGEPNSVSNVSAAIEYFIWTNPDFQREALAQGVERPERRRAPGQPRRNNRE